MSQKHMQTVKATDDGFAPRWNLVVELPWLIDDENSSTAIFFVDASPAYLFLVSSLKRLIWDQVIPLHT